MTSFLMYCLIFNNSSLILFSIFIFILEILEYHVVPHTEYSAGLYYREHIPTIDRHHDILRIYPSGE